MEDHIQSTADGLFGAPEPEVIDIADPPKKAKRDIRELLRARDSGERASSSTSKAVYPSGINPVQLPSKEDLKKPLPKRTKINGKKPPKAQSD